jgi:hypothetical protein
MVLGALVTRAVRQPKLHLRVDLRYCGPGITISALDALRERTQLIQVEDNLAETHAAVHDEPDMQLGGLNLDQDQRYHSTIECSSSTWISPSDPTPAQPLMTTNTCSFGSATVGADEQIRHDGEEEDGLPGFRIEDQVSDEDGEDADESDLEGDLDEAEDSSSAKSGAPAAFIHHDERDEQGGAWDVVQ